MRLPELNLFDVVKVPFPFTDKKQTKFRPAVILSSPENFGVGSGHAIMAMITSSRHSSFPLDMAVTDIISAGLPHGCVIRMKLFTLDYRLIESVLGRLGRPDQQLLIEHLRKLFPFFD